MYGDTGKSFDSCTVRLECTATAKTADAYQKGIEMTGRIWRVSK